MNLRRILLRLMLASLAVAAVVGAASVLMVPWETTWRIIGTGILTAVICGLLLRVSFLTDKPATRGIGLLGMGFLLIQFLLGLILIWQTLDVFMEELSYTAVFFPAVAIPALVLVRIASTKLGKWAGRIGVGLAVIEFLLLMIAVWTGDIDGGPGQWFGSSGACAIFFPLLILSLAGLGAAPGAWRRWPAIAAVLAALAVTLYSIWEDVHGHPGAYAVLVSVGAVLAYANIAMLCPLKAGQVWVRWIALLSATTTAACLDAIPLLDLQPANDFLGKLAAASGIIAACGTLAMAILAALNRKIERPAIMLQDVRSMEVICPLCKKKQTVATGGASCTQCGLRIVIHLEQRQCAKCGYLLYGLNFERCPECGTIVSEAAAESGSSEYLRTGVGKT